MYLGWEEPVNALMALEVAVQALLKRGLSRNERLGNATFAIASIRVVPDKLKSRHQRIISHRIDARVAEGMYFDFSKLSNSNAKLLELDIIDMYKALLIDIGRGYENFTYLYPKELIKKETKNKKSTAPRRRNAAPLSQSR